MNVERRPRAYFDRFADKPVKITPFDATSKQESFQYLATLNEILAPLDVLAELFGSTDLEIAGKGEWEFAIYLDDRQWYPVLIRLINHFGAIYELSDDFVLFEDSHNGTPIEVIPMRGETAQRNQAVMGYWRTHHAALKEYEAGKSLHAHSKREYYWWKENLIADILEPL